MKENQVGVKLHEHVSSRTTSWRYIDAPVRKCLYDLLVTK